LIAVDNYRVLVHDLFSLGLKMFDPVRQNPVSF